MDLADIIASLGFPAAVAAFALWNSYQHEIFLQKTLSDTIQKNTDAILSLRDYIKTKDKERGEED